MQSFADIRLDGYVGSAPIIREGKDGPFASLSLAVNRRWKKGDEIFEKTDWYRITVPTYMVNLVQNYVRKGDPLTVFGEPEIRQWIQSDKQSSGIYVYARKILLHTSRAEKEALSSESVEEPSSFEMAEVTERKVDAEFPPFPEDESHIA